jgi:3-methyladenine DNA glycosylase Tag
MSTGGWSPPKWMYQDRKPPDDDGYFENMTRVVFLAGLSWRMIDGKWPNFRRAFDDFSVDAVAEMTESDVKKLKTDASIVRNEAKIAATVNNARQFQKIRRLHGSFRQYLESQNKSDNYASVVRELVREFSRMGPSSARIFLYSVGEDIKRPMEQRAETPSLSSFC